MDMFYRVNWGVEFKYAISFCIRCFLNYVAFEALFGKSYFLPNFRIQGARGDLIAYLKSTTHIIYTYQIF